MKHINLKSTNIVSRIVDKLSGKSEIYFEAENLSLVFANSSIGNHEISGRVLNSVLLCVAKDVKADHTEQANT